ncbi:DUF1711-domain-containing protein [Amniculicola lignicola CBS 123094]|uniref:DUF1711-domain-containing protein n=1 Tax=Amniculicola lignicola CBS 123094 TaxID=1392246 RepID=A0A6A5X061_9PLEO|nr:DUF1711-domain-containing protein [Amniculicola lignicola CBS 123094]
MSTKTAKTKTVVLKLSPDHLSKFPHIARTPPASSQEAAKSTSSSDTPVPQVVEPAASEMPSDSAAATPVANGTSTPSSSLAPPAAGGKRKGVPGPKPGTKRGAGALATDGVPKPRGKPGPKKRKMGDAINDPNHKGPFAAPTPLHKLGPKANQGAINAGLRALDRTGKPCRKWEKRGLKLRSFTGVQWDVPTWRAPKRSAVFAEDVKSDSTGSSDSKSKIKDESSAISEKSNAVAEGSTPTALAAPPNGEVVAPTAPAALPAS